MPELYGSDFINDILVNDSAIVAIVGTSISENLLVPSTDKSLETINYYKTGLVDGRIEYGAFRWSIDCRSKAYLTSRDLASLVFDAFNRVNATVNSKFYYAVVDILTTLPPVDNTDVYNTPVSVYVRRK